MLALRSFVGLTLVIDLVVGPVLVTEVLVASILVIDLVVGPNRGGVVMVGELTVGVGIEISVGVDACTGALPASKLFLGLSTVVIVPSLHWSLTLFFDSNDSNLSQLTQLTQITGEQRMILKRHYGFKNFFPLI